jgi:hypothetical protein
MPSKERPSSAAAGAECATNLGKPTCPRCLLQRLVRRLTLPLETTAAHRTPDDPFHEREVARPAAGLLVARRDGHQLLGDRGLDAGVQEFGAGHLDRRAVLQVGPDGVQHPLGLRRWLVLQHGRLELAVALAALDVVAVVLGLEQRDEVQSEVGRHPQVLVTLLGFALGAVELPRRLLDFPPPRPPDDHERPPTPRDFCRRTLY